MPEDDGTAAPENQPTSVSAQPPPERSTAQAQISPPAQEPEIDWKAKVEELTRESRKWEARAKENAAAAKEVEKLRTASMSEQEKALAEAKAEGRKAALAEANDRLVRAELRAVAAGKLADPSDAAALLGDLSEFVAASGDVDTKAMASAIDALVKAKPYLAPQQAKPAPLPGGGATPSNGSSMDDWIRQAAGRR